MNQKNKKILVFATSGKERGGSGFRWLVDGVEAGIIENAEICTVISSYKNGGVAQHAKETGIRHIYFPKPRTKEAYQEAVRQYNPDLICLSGWMHMVYGLDPRITINIHPGPLPTFGGKGMYGDNVHKAIEANYKKGKIQTTAVSMHFVSDDNEYDTGPVFFEKVVGLRREDAADDIGSRVNEVEHADQAFYTNEVLQGRISWDGVNRNSLIGKVSIGKIH